jgi:hypothetical protein
MQDARDSKPGTGAKDVGRYEHVKCATCGATYQRIDFRSALHAIPCTNPKEA